MPYEYCCYICKESISLKREKSHKACRNKIARFGGSTAPGVLTLLSATAQPSYSDAEEKKRLERRLLATCLLRLVGESDWARVPIEVWEMIATECEGESWIRPFIAAESTKQDKYQQYLSLAGNTYRQRLSLERNTWSDLCNIDGKSNAGNPTEHVFIGGGKYLTSLPGSVRTGVTESRVFAVNGYGCYDVASPEDASRLQGRWFLHVSGDMAQVPCHFQGLTLRNVGNDDQLLLDHPMWPPTLRKWKEPQKPIGDCSKRGEGPPLFTRMRTRKVPKVCTGVTAVFFCATMIDLHFHGGPTEQDAERDAEADAFFRAPRSGYSTVFRYAALRPRELIYGAATRYLPNTHISSAYILFHSSQGRVLDLGPTVHPQLARTDHSELLAAWRSELRCLYVNVRDDHATHALFAAPKGESDDALPVLPRQTHLPGTLPYRFSSPSISVFIDIAVMGAEVEVCEEQEPEESVQIIRGIRTNDQVLGSWKEPEHRQARKIAGLYLLNRPGPQRCIVCLVDEIDQVADHGRYSELSVGCEVTWWTSGDSSYAKVTSSSPQTRDSAAT